jgi:muramoyltetrapeptide carboxypeptidase LdcA involved in peptidoglycan recycling
MTPCLGAGETQRAVLLQVEGTIEGGNLNTLISCIGVLPFHCATMYYTRPAEPTDQGQHVASDMVLCCF